MAENIVPTKLLVKNDFDIDIVLKKTLRAHISTVENGEPRNLPLPDLKVETLNAWR